VHRDPWLEQVPRPRVSPEELPKPSPWVEIARVEAREWFRDNPRAWDDFDEWVEGKYVPDLLRVGFGWKPGDRMTAKMIEAMDAALEGVAQAQLEEQDGTTKGPDSPR
jgi:hypothetical protein